jgi:hypothetical protein
MRVQNERMRDSTICEESHKILCERDTQKLNEKEDESFEELFTTNMMIPSSSLVPCVMQAHEEKDVVNYGQSPIFDEEDQVMTMNSDTYVYVASQDVEVIVRQNLCENESHNAKLRVKTKASCVIPPTMRLRASNIRVRDTPQDRPQKNGELECKSCEDIFKTNTLISTPSVVFPNVQLCNENKEEMAVHDNSILVERSVKVAIHPNQLCAAQNMNHYEESGKTIQASSMIIAPPKSLKGNENNSDLSLHNKIMSNCDRTHGSNGVDHSQKVYADLIISHVHPCAEILQVDNQCSIIHDLFYALIWFIYMILCTHISNTLHANKFGNVKMYTHDEYFAKISPSTCVCMSCLTDVLRSTMEVKIRTFKPWCI